jgi:sulfate adenylyltransferase
MVKQHKLVSGVDQASMNSKGICIWFTGRSGAGKSSITNALLPLLDESGRVVSVLDVVPVLKKRWCEKTSEGKLLRKAFVANEIVRHGGVVICVTVSARRRTREAARKLIGPDKFIEVFVDVPLEVANARRARRKHKTPFVKRARRWLRRVLGSLPFRKRRSYQLPSSPDVTIDTSLQSPEESAQVIFQLLLDQGFLVPEYKGNRPRVGAEVSKPPQVIGQFAEGFDESQRRPHLSQKASASDNKK